MIEILEFKIKKDRTKIGVVKVKYHDLVIRTELVYNKPSGNVWLRMPEMWKDGKNKKSYCSWPRKDISDTFQSIALAKFYKKYDLSPEKIKNIFLEKMCEKNKKDGQNTK